MRLDDFIETLKELIRISDQEQYGINLTYGAIKEIIDDKRLEAFSIIDRQRVNMALYYASHNANEYNNELIRLYGKDFIDDRLLTDKDFVTIRIALSYKED
jgi:hypothetical protein